MNFCTDENELFYEKLMKHIPNFGPFGHGTYDFGGFIYLTADGDCRFCFYSDEDRICTLAECPRIRKRIIDGTITLPELIKYTFKKNSNPYFQKRLQKLITESEKMTMIYQSDTHKEMFTKALNNYKCRENTFLAALYLLTANKYLWSRTRHMLSGNRMDFATVHLGNASPNVYTLFVVTKDICIGSKHLSISDLGNVNIVSRKLFNIICFAMTIRRYGMTVLDMKGVISC